MTQPVIAGAFVEIRPATDRFRGELLSDLRAATSGADAKIGVDPKIRGFDRELRDKVETPLRRSGDRVSGMVRGQVASIRNAFVAGFAGVAAVNLFRDAVTGATDLAEAQSKVNVVFGEFAPKVRVYAQAADDIGLSDRAAEKALGTFGNLFLSLGATQAQAAKLSPQVVTLGADLASFNNIGVDETLEKLRSGLVGEIEPLRSLGVSFGAVEVANEAVRLGLAKTNKEVSEGAKLQARLSLILAQTKTAHGDAARTIDGLAGRTKQASARFEDLKDRVGTQLVPRLADLAEVTSERVLPAFEATFDFVARNKDVLLPLAGVATAVVAVNKAIKIGESIADSALVRISRRIAANTAQAASERSLATAITTRNAAEGASGGLPVPGGRGRPGIPGTVPAGLTAAGAALLANPALAAGLPVGGGLLLDQLVFKPQEQREIKGIEGINELRKQFKVLDDRRAVNAAGVAIDDPLLLDILTQRAGGGAAVRKLQSGNPGLTSRDKLIQRDIDLLTELSERTDGLQETTARFFATNVQAGDASFRAFERAGQAAAEFERKASPMAKAAVKIREAAQQELPKVAELFGGVFDPIPERAALSFAQVRKRIADQGRNSAALRADVETLAKRGISEPIIRELLALEQTAPGTIRRVTKEGIGQPFVDEFNKTVGQINGDKGAIANVLAGIFDQARRDQAAAAGADLGKAFGRGFKDALDGALGTVALNSTGALARYYESGRGSADRVLGRAAGARGVR
jgi:hypothetical protein